jgi:DNA gyrase subunit A
MSILQHVEFSIEQRDAYLRMATQARRADGAEDEAEEASVDALLTAEEYERFAAQDQFILTITENGYGKRTSAFEYRVSGRGGQGFANIEMSERNGQVVASFPVSDADQVMLISNGGQLIRMGITDVRVASRKTQGVTLFRTAADEKVVSAAWLPEMSGEDEDTEAEQDVAGGEESAAADLPAVGNDQV